MSIDFKQAIAVPDGRINLAQAALLFAHDVYPDLDPATYLAQLDEWADRLRPQIDLLDEAQPFQPLNDLLFDQLSFRGNRHNYYDPRNSYLNVVMEQRVGLPITISTIYLEVGWRVGLPLSGVGLPGHFIVRCDGPRNTWFIDPYNRGDVLNESDCARLIHQATNGRLTFDREQLKSVSRRSILSRMLNNLKAIYIQNEQFTEVRQVMQRLLDLDPESAEDVRDMGLVHFRLGEYRKAISTLESYFILQKDADDIDDIRQVISAARSEMARWN